MSLESKILALKDRALLFEKVRSFFASKGVLEVDTPLLSPTAPIDEHIEIMDVSLGDGKVGYLHSSPEYAMKRLLAMGLGDIYQMSHVFRQGELSPLHNPEFTMVEWYRLHMPFEDFIEETASFINLFLPKLPLKKISYRKAFLQFAKIDYLHATQQELLACAKSHNIDIASPLSKEDLLHLIMGFVVEPHLGKDSLEALVDYPASQAALAQTELRGDEPIAKRFEIYYKGVELANGYLELTDAKKQEERLLESQAKRKEAGKPHLPIDKKFIEALSHGIPDCCGVAVGFDRLLLLKREASSLKEVLPFSFEEL
jgi:elongation factor P--(R)-beta-lysine ligase